MHCRHAVHQAPKVQGDVKAQLVALIVLWRRQRGQRSKNVGKWSQCQLRYQTSLVALLVCAGSKVHLYEYVIRGFPHV